MTENSASVLAGTAPTAVVRLLLVDDEVAFAQVMIKRLGRRGIKVTPALSGQEAIQTLRRADFDVVVLDLKLSDMDGIEILKIFKKMAPEVPVIMLTGHGCEIAAQDGLRLGAHAYLTKPCDFDELLAMIHGVLGKRETGHGNL
jgi:DNA-binding response OmpR family regulator